MTKKSVNKIVSAILVMAIMLTTVFSCLITVNAADTEATYVISAEAVPAYGYEGKATITFDLGTGFTGGSFTLLKNFSTPRDEEITSSEQTGNRLSMWSYEFCDVELKPVSGTASDGGEFSEADFTVTNDVFGYVNSTLAEGSTYERSCKTDRLSDVTFTSSREYTSVTFECTFTWDYHIRLADKVYGDKTPIDFATSEQTDRYGKAYLDPVLTNGETSYTLTEVNDGVNDFFHTHQFKIVDGNANFNEKLSADGSDYNIYLGKCSCCGATQSQVYPSATSSLYQHRYYDISAVNVEYKDDGTVSLNVHCATFNGANERLVICYGDGTKAKYGEISGSEAIYSHYAKIRTELEDGTYSYSEGALPAGTYMYVIDGLSTRDIENELYLTRTVTTAGTDYWGNTHTFTLKDYCLDVIDGDKVYYPEGTTDKQKAADKKVSAAMINYGVAAANALNNKVVTVVDTWDGTRVAPTETDELGNIIINTAEELAWIALEGAADTANKNYKVAANSVFNMNGMTGIILNSTAADVKDATKNQDRIWRSVADSDDYSFRGNFDGNGLIVYNIYADGYANAGLFPVINPSTQGTITIKNVTVAASYIAGYHYIGGIVGHGNADGTGKKLVFENCAAKNNYLYDMGKGSGHNRTAATIVATVRHNGTTINNCLAIGNEISATGIIGGLFGNTSDFAAAATVSNSISIGTNIEPTSKEVVFGSKVANTTYTNNYDSTTALTGADAVSGMGLNNIVWLATDSYPELNPMRLGYDEWDGTTTEPTATDADDNIIISTAEEMAWLALVGGDTTVGKTYKVADGIKYFNMNGMNGITLNSTATDVKNATTTGSGYEWYNDSAVFKGDFDGNGVVIYNIAGRKGAAYGGLFPRMICDKGTFNTIENVTVKASVFYGYHEVGGILGSTDAQFTVDINKCTVDNCYLAYYSGDGGGNKCVGTVVGRTQNTSINITDCLVVDNIIESANSSYSLQIKGGFIARSSTYAPTGIKITNSVSIGTSPYPTVVGTGTITIGDDIVEAVWTNVYTDQAVSQTGIITCNKVDMTGEEADETMPNLAWNSVWYTGAPGEYPSFVDDGLIYVPTAIADYLTTAEYASFVDSFATTYTADSFNAVAPGDCDYYASSLTLKANPYISVTFAFREQYLTNKQNVNAIFTVGGNTYKVNAADMINNNSNPDFRAGRYHLARLKDIPIKDLCDYITVELTYNGESMGKGTISVAGFALTAMDMGEEYELYAEAARALVYYSKALQERYVVVTTE